MEKLRHNALAQVTTVRTCHAVLVASKVRHHRERKCHCCAVPGRLGKFHTQMQPCRAHFALQKSPLPNLHPPMSQQIRPQSMHFNLNEDTKLKSTGMTTKMSAKSDAVVSKWLLWSLQKHHMCCKSEKHAFVSCHGNAAETARLLGEAENMLTIHFHAADTPWFSSLPAKRSKRKHFLHNCGVRNHRTK